MLRRLLASERSGVVKTFRYVPQINGDDTFTDDFTRVYSFVDRVLVSCPNCSQCATMTRADKRLICPHCGRTKTDIYWDIIGPNSCTLGLSLFLQTDCCCLLYTSPSPRD